MSSSLHLKSFLLFSALGHDYFIFSCADLSQEHIFEVGREKKKKYKIFFLGIINNREQTANYYLRYQ